MAAFRSIASVVDLAPPSVGSIIVPKPAGVVAGDLLVSIVASYATFSIITSFPTGWDRTPLSGFGSLTSVRGWKIAGSSEPANYTVSWVGSSGGKVLGIIAAYSNPGWMGQYAIQMDNKEASNSSNPFVVAGSDYANLASRLVTKIYLISTAHGTGTITPPGTVTQRAMVQTSGGGNAGISTFFGDEFTDYLGAIETRSFSHNVSTFLQMSQLLAFRESTESFVQEHAVPSPDRSLPGDVFSQDRASPGSRVRRTLVLSGGL